MQYFTILQLESVEIDDKYGNINYFAHLIQDSPDDGFLSVPGCEMGSPVSEGMKGTEQKAAIGS